MELTAIVDIGGIHMLKPVTLTEPSMEYVTNLGCDSLRDQIIYEMICRAAQTLEPVDDDEILRIHNEVLAECHERAINSLQKMAKFIADGSMYELVVAKYKAVLEEVEEMAEDDYLNQLSAAYWEEVDEMENGIHPCQIRERAETALGYTLPDNVYCQYIGNNIVKYWSSVNKEQLIATFDYIENKLIEE